MVPVPATSCFSMPSRSAILRPHRPHAIRARIATSHARERSSTTDGFERGCSFIDAPATRSHPRSADEPPASSATADVSDRVISPTYAYRHGPGNLNGRANLRTCTSSCGRDSHPPQPRRVETSRKTVSIVPPFRLITFDGGWLIIDTPEGRPAYRHRVAHHHSVNCRKLSSRSRRRTIRSCRRCSAARCSSGPIAANALSIASSTCPLLRGDAQRRDRIRALHDAASKVRAPRAERKERR